MNRPRIAVMGTFDTKAEEYQYIIDRIGQLGADVLTIDVSTRDTAVLRGEYGCREIAQYAGSTYELLTSGTRAESMAIIMEGATKLVRQLLQEGRIQGLVSIGGSGGTTLATHVMRALPIGFPKVIATTQACSDKLPGFISGKDIIVINSVVDVSGLNSIISHVYDEAAGAVVGAALAYTPHPADKPRIAISMYGITTPCVVHAAKYLETRGYEPIIFHANGAGGKAMKTLIAEGMFQGVLDITTAEVGAYVLDAESSSAGEDRLDAAVLAGLPQVVSVGGMDVIGIRVDQLHTKFQGYTPYSHNDKPDMIRTSPEDGIRICQSAVSPRWTSRAARPATTRRAGCSTNPSARMPAQRSRWWRWTVTSMTRPSPRPWPSGCAACWRQKNKPAGGRLQSKTGGERHELSAAIL